MRIKKRFSHVRIIALGYFIMIALGAVLLMLPISAADRSASPFLEALFTSTSASCVTGLVLRDTATHWSGFGQAVILVLIQIGGLGFMTISTFFFLFMRRQVGLRSRAVMSESINVSHVGEIISLTRIIVTGTAVTELTGAVLLSIRFIPLFGPGRGTWLSIFHSVSAFCNAGFDLMGGYSGPFSSFTAWAGDPLVNITLILLILIGGIGFLVWADVLKNGLRLRRYSLHSKVVLSTTAVITVCGAALFWLLERGYTGAGLSTGQQILQALFASVTPRTAGFNTVDLGAMNDASKLLTTVFMYIGGSPGSTAGGVKTATVAVILFFAVSHMRGSTYVGAFGLKIPEDAIRKALVVASFNLTLGLIGSIVTAASGIPLSDSVLEAFSAISTVGLSTGVTRDLTVIGRIVIILLMYSGRLGSVTFATALFERRARPPVTAPAGSITIG
ncbi:MAG: Trk family potassium uptake protein [Oscillospiraceae bacterium]|nr:Trk family potassium uptake protein [Oscillospiraceae bacterium]